MLGYFIKKSVIFVYIKRRELFLDKTDLIKSVIINRSSVIMKKLPNQSVASSLKKDEKFKELMNLEFIEYIKVNITKYIVVSKFLEVKEMEV